MTGAIAILIAALLLVVLIWAGQRRMMYFPFGPAVSPSEAGLADAEAVTFATNDGLQLHGWFLPARQSPAWFTIIVFNGNAGNRAFRVPLARALHRHNMSVLLFDYRGFGGNPGSPTEGGLESDARAARAWLDSRSDVDQSRIIYFGESLGAAVAAKLAAERAPAALILRSPFASMAEIGKLHYPLLPVRWLLRDRFEARDAMRSLTAPVLVIAGDRDSIIPLTETRKLFEASRAPKELVIIEGADHNDEALLSGQPMIAAVVKFLRGLR